MLKRIGQVAASPLTAFVAVLVLVGFALWPSPSALPLVVVLNGEQLEFPRDLHKLDAEQARLQEEIAAMMLVFTEAYPADGKLISKPGCPYGGCK